MTEVVPTDSGNAATAALESLTTGAGIVTTAQASTFDQRKEVLAAALNAVPLADHLGEVIPLVNIVAQAVTVTDAATGDETDAVRTVLIAEDGTSYGAVSTALVSSLRDIFAVLGQPNTWPAPVGIVVTEEKGKVAGRKFFKVSLAPTIAATE